LVVTEKGGHSWIVKINSVKELKVYKESYAMAMEIFEVSKQWPPDERYSLIGQIRKCTRSVCSNLREAWAKRRYQAHFLTKLTDCDGENIETDTWLDFARDCGYLKQEDYERLAEKCRSVGRMLGSMLMNPDPFLLKL
jgi:four helix bundle protein